MTANAQPEKILAKGDETVLTVESLAYGGQGVARVGEFVVFVQGALPGEKVVSRITHRKKRWAEAEVIRHLKNSGDQVDAPCDHFPTCGGCTFQHLSYPAQIEQKKQQVVELFRRIGRMEVPGLNPVIGADEIFHYRNKMEFSFADRKRTASDEGTGGNSTTVLGLHVEGRHDTILDIETCWIQKPAANRILQTVKEVVRREGLDPYDVVTHRGFLKNLVIRMGENTGDIMVNLVTSREQPHRLEPVVNVLLGSFPDLTSIVNNITRRKASVTYGEREIILHGSPSIQETMGEYRFEISANSFFRPNTPQAEKLYRLVLQFADLSGDEVVYDLYSGTGTLSILAARWSKEVYGLEIVPNSVEDAMRNALSNQAFNCRFFRAKLDGPFPGPGAVGDIPGPDVVLLDPPRTGVDSRLLEDIVGMAPAKAVYISCDPSTQARDVSGFAEGGYRLTKLAMVDMFPHTPRIETVALLERSTVSGAPLE